MDISITLQSPVLTPCIVDFDGSINHLDIFEKNHLDIFGVGGQPGPQRVEKIVELGWLLLGQLHTWAIIQFNYMSWANQKEIKVNKCLSRNYLVEKRSTRD